MEERERGGQGERERERERGFQYFNELINRVVVDTSLSMCVCECM